MTDLGALVQNLFAAVLAPGRWLLQVTGFHPSDMQVWALMVAAFMLAIGIPGTYGDWMLTRRQKRTRGTIVSIDRSSDYDTPRIAFSDLRGETVEFNSNLPLRLGSRRDRRYARGGLRPAAAAPCARGRAARAEAVSTLFWYAMAVALIGYAVIGTG